MKRIIIGILVIVLSLSVAGCENGRDSDSYIKETQTDGQGKEKAMNGIFRYANWGDSIDSVVELEGSNYIVKDAKGVMYDNIDLMGYNTEVIYLCGENGLYSGIYNITEEHSNENNYIDDFNKINESLKQKYGPPTTEQVNWVRDILKDDPGLALGYGDVEYTTAWESEDLTIIHYLEGDNFEIEHAIMYGNPKADAKSDTSGL